MFELPASVLPLPAVFLPGKSFNNFEKSGSDAKQKRLEIVAVVPKVLE